jgi:hypothetical protein
MKGGETFTAHEIAALRRLIAEKQTADRARQKSLRQRMRAIGFYITDFVGDQKGFTVSDFDELLQQGLIRIEESGKAAQPRRRVTSQRPVRGERPQYSDEEREQARARRERAAQQFKPETVDLLLVAEAPPSILERYFYFPDVREQDSLFCYVCRGVLGREPTREAKPDLLAELRDRGVFLVDLQEEPRDETDEAPLSQFAPHLVERCKALAPGWIVLIKATVFDAAHGALEDAGLPVSSVRVPFPGSGRQKEFEEAFRGALAERRSASGPSSRR